MNETVTLIHGSQSFSGSSAKINVFCLKTDGTAGRCFPSEVLTKETYRKVPASVDGLAVNGVWHHAMYKAMDGVVLMIQAGTTLHGRRYNDAIQILALRSGAPLIAIDCNIPENRLAVTSQCRCFCGRADIINPSELEDYGIVLNRSFVIDHTAADELSELFAVREIAPALEGRPKAVVAQLADGNTKKVLVPAAPKRRIRLRSDKT